MSLEMPYDKDLEDLLIGNVLLNKRLTVEDKTVSVVDFYSTVNQKIWQVFCEMDEDSESIEISDVQRRVALEHVTMSALGKMAIGLVGDTRPEDIKALKDLATLRELIRTYAKLARMAERKETVENILAENSQALDQIQNEQEKRHGTSQSLVEVMEREVFPRLDKFVSGEMVKVPFGFTALDASSNGGASLGELVVLGALPKSGKALSLDTKIATPTGWTTMGEIKVGDQVFDENGRVCNVTATTEIMYDRPCYEVEFNNGVKVIADEQHEWQTRTTRRFRSQSALAKNKMRDNYMTSPFSVDMSSRQVPPDGVVTTKEISQTLRLSDGKLNHRIQTALPLDLPEQDLPIDPYVLGAWLGDGTSRTGQITTADTEMIDLIRSKGYTVGENKVKYHYMIFGLMVTLRSLDLLQNKHIPVQYLRASFEQRLEVLQGLMDTDGYCCPKKGICEFTTTSPQLAKNTLDLIGTLGINAKMYEGRATLYGRDISAKWRISFQTPLPVFRLERKASRQSQAKFKGQHMWRGIKNVTPIESVPVKCIQVDSPSHLYLITDRYIATHNSVLLGQIARQQAEQGIPTYMASLEMLNYENGFRFLAQSSDFSMNIFRPDMYADTARRLKDHARSTYDIPYRLDQKSRNLREIGNEIARLKDNADVISAFVDYVQLIGTEKRIDNRAAKIEEIIYGLKDLAMKHEIVVYTAAQFNREGIKSEKPSMAHFDGSSAIEKAANLILMWTLEKDYNPEKRGREGKLWIEAGRSIACDEFDVIFHGADARFTVC